MTTSRHRIRAGAPRLALGWALALASTAAWGQEGLAVVATTPAARALAVPVDSAITVRFDRPVLGSSVTGATFWAFGRWSGPVHGVLEESFDALEVTLVPDQPLSAGEQVTVYLSRDLLAADGTTLRAAGYSFQFWTASLGTGFDFREIDRLTTRGNPEASTRAYGGFGSDLDGDGFLDLTIVNEDTNDLRTFLNRGDRSGRMRRMLRPPARTGAVPSPSEPADFDRDGHVDVAVANTRDTTVSILLGNGDGTFAPATHVEVGGEPRGIAVLDADGDGDVDVAATSVAEGRVTVLLNDGAGGFTESRRIETGGATWALAAGDLDGDGILDLVVGDQADGGIHVYAGRGGGDFERVSTGSSGGAVWMLALGDVDGDGDEDVAAVNSATNNAAILLGDGAGGLAPPRMTSTDDFPLATDLADLDGDGDLDWLTSSFFGDWLLFENTGRGSFRLAESFDAPEAASCTLAMDLDNDGVLDLVLIDELADEIVLMGSRAEIFASDFETGDASEWKRRRGAWRVVSPGLGGTDHALEVAVGEERRGTWVQTRLPSRETSVRVELLLDPARVDLAGSAIELLRLGKGRGEARLMLIDSLGTKVVQLSAKHLGSWTEIGQVPVRPRGAVRIGIGWASGTVEAPGNGWASLTRNGREIASRANLHNAGSTVRRLRLGLLWGSDGFGEGGVVRFDEVVVHR